ncbi:MAG: ribonuclease III [Actinobacteria bacterium]|jgi:ribonuclease-3|nr:MAG: ribonuclease III [Actinomycetota bacterium]
MLFKRRGRKREAIEDILLVDFRDKELLHRALTHRSYAHETCMPADYTNERLEFLGDAVLDVVVSDHLYRKHSELNEGDLTRIRSNLVNMNSLADTARELGIGEHVLLSREERADGGGEKASIIADTLEALIGAVYLDQGLNEAGRLCMRLFEQKLEEAVSGTLDYDYKSRLQEMVVKDRGVLPRYRLREEGPDHRKTFHATVFVADEKMGTGSGSSKKEAEQEAAREALDRMACI